MKKKNNASYKCLRSNLYHFFTDPGHNLYVIPNYHNRSFFWALIVEDGWVYVMTCNSWGHV